VTLLRHKPVLVWHSLTLTDPPDPVCPQPLNPKVQGSTPCASTTWVCKFG